MGMPMSLARRTVRVRTSILAVSLVILVGSALPASAASGALDRSFGRFGLVLSRGLFPGLRSDAHAVAVQRDGKIVAVGHATVGELIPEPSAPPADGFAMARYGRDGSVDRTFGRGGTIVTRGEPEGAAWDVAIQRDGKIVVVGGDPGFAIRRFMPNGRADRSFRPQPAVDRPAVAYAVLIQPDGKILVAGGVQASATGTDLVIARYRADGSLDPSFGDRGVVLLGVPSTFDYVEDLALQPDGGIVAAGWSADTTFGVAGIMVARLSPSGAVDPVLNPVVSWARQVPVRGQYQFANAVAVRPDGRILLAGWGAYGRGLDLYENVVLLQYLPDGTLDPDFGDGGVVIVNTTEEGYDEAADLVIQGDGKAVVVGMSSWQFGLVMRVLPDGRLDPSFGQQGLVKTALPGLYSANLWTGVALQPDGRIVTSGLWCYSTRTTNGTRECRFAIARYLG
jgi:uncharacterized delta-60 repeat protein